MSPSVRVASGVGLTLLVSVSIMYVVVSGVQSVPRAPEVTSATQNVTEQQQTGFSSWVLSRLPFLPWSPKEKQLFAVMIENHQAARPHHLGLDKAVLVQEFFVEGFISRFVALFSVDDLPEEIGPVRSLRPYFVDTFTPWTPFVFHAGGSPEALQAVQNDSSIQNYNALYLEEDYYDRKVGVPAPHDLFLPMADIQTLLQPDIEQFGRTVRVPLYPTGKADNGSGATTIDINFYSSAHNVQYTYNTKKRTYERINGRVLSPAAPANVVVVEMAVEEVGPLGRLAIDTVGSGRALFFRSGKQYSGTWQRGTSAEPYIFLVDTGEPMIFAAGQIWLTSVNDIGRVQWQ